MKKRKKRGKITVRTGVPVVTYSGPHKTVKVYLSNLDMTVEIDKNITSLIKVMNATYGVWTYYCCEGDKRFRNPGVDMGYVFFGGHMAKQLAHYVLGSIMAHRCGMSLTFENTRNNCFDKEGVTFRWNPNDYVDVLKCVKSACKQMIEAGTWSQLTCKTQEG